MEKILIKDIGKIDIKNKIIVFPTDTVYGIGCRIQDLNAVQRIYDIKNRDFSKPLAILCPDDKIEDYVEEISDEAYDLMKKYWPGALTIIFKKSDKIDDMITSNKDTVGLRVPNNEIALAVLRKFGLMATTSMNISGQSALNNIDDIEKYFGDKIDYLVIDKCELSKVSSTVVDASTKELKILRQGDIQI